ncbi:carbohydrate-binding domain-containing protein, partial [Leuconostoc litchii]|uniref:carbohydrate-binding domain-containing protein n=1 Tax=Leuconostoc litchii TaxID=1981069 RepID=UPI001FCCB12C
STSATTSSDSTTTTDESTSATTSSDSTTTTDGSASATTNSEDDASITNTSNIAFSESSTIITGNGATNIGNTVTINESGTYYVEGSSTNAQIIIDAPVTAVIKLVFNNVDLANQIGAVINGKQFGSLVVENVGTNNITSSVVIDDEDTLDIINPNGAIYADGDLTIEGSGTLNISSTMNGISADGTLTINSGTLNITKSYEALEGEIITINGGIINLNSSDDIINAQLDQTKYDSGSTDEQAININGGTLTIRGNGDGLDSNGDINITGGTIIDLIDSTPDNGALDSDGTITFTGGMIIWGGSGTEGTPEESTSTQSYVAIGSVSAGSIISITKNGEEFVNTIIPDITTYLNISVPGIVAGETYQVTINGVSSNIVAGQGGGSGMTAEGGMGPMGTPPDGQFGQGAFPPNDGILTSGEMSSIRQNNLIKSITNTSNSTENISQNTTISANTMQDNGSISMEPKLTADDPDNKINYDSAAKTNSFEPENYVVTLNKASLATDENQQSSVNKTNATDDKKTIISSTSTLPKTGTTNSSVFASIVAILLEFGLLAGLRKKYISTKNTNLF